MSAAASSTTAADIDVDAKVIEAAVERVTLRYTIMTGGKDFLLSGLL